MAPEPPERPVAPTLREAVQRWRLVLAREPLPAGMGQREQLAAWDAALVASGLPAAGLDADPPRARFAIAAPLGAGLFGEEELMDVWLVERVPTWRVREALERSMPPSHMLRQAYDVWLGEAALPGQVVASTYRARVAANAGVSAAVLEDACRALLAAPTIERERTKGGATVRDDLRPFIETLEAAPGPGAGETTVRMTLRHDPARGVGRPDEVVSAIAARVGLDALPTDSVVRERLVLAPPPIPAPPRPRGPRHGRQAATPVSRPRK